MNDSTFTDMGPFLNGHDRRTRRLFVAAIATTLLISVAGLAFGFRDLGSLAAIPGRLWFPILFYPLPIIGLWMAGAGASRKRRKQPDGRFPMNPDDARNTARVANAGAVFVTGIGLVLIASQLGSVLNFFHVLPSLGGLWLSRAAVVGTGALMVYFGNAWPRIPTPRAPEYKPATQRNFNRFYGWMVVIHGLLLVLVGLLLTDPVMFAKGAGVVSLSMLLFAVGWVLMFVRAVKAPKVA